MSSKDQKIAQFDPNSISLHPGVFGLPFTFDEAELVFLPVPWDVTTSYGAGTSNGPGAILDASYQVDLMDPEIPDAWKAGHYWQQESSKWIYRNKTYRAMAEKYIRALEKGAGSELSITRDKINAASVSLNQWVYEECRSLLEKDKKVILVGGDHSTPFGFIRALAKDHEDFAILQIDAHADLREAYEGFTYSHASIMYNVLEEIPEVKKLVQVGIRDYCQEERNRMDNDERIVTFYDHDLKRKKFNGTTWADEVTHIVERLPEKVYISFDIDGLDPKLCPNTGTPVPSGLDFDEVLYLMEQLTRSGKTIIGMDLNEVAPGDDEWDANVGARLLWRMSNLFLSQKKGSR